MSGQVARVRQLKRERVERYNLRRGWFAYEWRIVDENGKDMVQPWFRKKGEARDVAHELNIVLIEY